MANETVNRDDIEKALWKWSGWQADQRSVDTILGLVDQYKPGAVTVQLPTEKRRRCSQCGAVKPIDRFKPDYKGRGGRRAQCRDCENARRRERRARA